MNLRSRRIRRLLSALTARCSRARSRLRASVSLNRRSSLLSMAFNSSSDISPIVSVAVVRIVGRARTIDQLHDPFTLRFDLVSQIGQLSPNLVVVPVRAVQKLTKEIF